MGARREVPFDVVDGVALRGRPGQPLDGALDGGGRAGGRPWVGRIASRWSAGAV